MEEAKLTQVDKISHAELAKDKVLKIASAFLPSHSRVRVVYNTGSAFITGLVVYNTGTAFMIGYYS